MKAKAVFGAILFSLFSAAHALSYSISVDRVFSDSHVTVSWIDPYGNVTSKQDSGTDSAGVFYNYYDPQNPIGHLNDAKGAFQGFSSTNNYSFEVFAALGGGAEGNVDMGSLFHLHTSSAYLLTVDSDFGSKGQIEANLSFVDSSYMFSQDPELTILDMDGDQILHETGAFVGNLALNLGETYLISFDWQWNNDYPGIFDLHESTGFEVAIDPTETPVPEPSAIILLISGCFCLWGWKRYRS